MRALLWLVVATACAGCAAPADGPALPLGEAPAECGGCHEDHYDQWASSPHAHSGTSPVFTALLPDVESAWGETARGRCVTCHEPDHDGTGRIGCLSCHAAVGNHAERDGMLVVDPSVPLAGELDDPETTLAHGSRPAGFLASPSLCGTCHELTGPGLMQEPTLSEYRASPEAAAGMTCLDCHLPQEEPRPLSNDSTRVRPHRSHELTGFDPPWGAPAARAEDAAERTRRMLALALSVSIEAAPSGVAVSVTNVGAGHAVPTGVTFLRDLWVDLEVDGELAHPRVLRVGDQPMAGDQPVPLLTDADHVRTGSLGPGETKRVVVPVEGTNVVAHLRGRAIRDDVLEALGLSARRSEVPTHEIAQAALQL